MSFSVIREISMAMLDWCHIYGTNLFDVNQFR
jgi:hypothetical protein